MPRAKKKLKDSSKSAPSERAEKDFAEQRVGNRASAPSSKSGQNRPGQRRRGWRDIEAITERARLKKMLVDIWHEDVELDEDIFGE